MSLRQLTKSLHYAFRGLALVYDHEQNFRVQLFAFVAVMTVAAWTPVRAWELVAIALVGGAVLVLECINSALERLLDIVKPRLHGYVEEVKDIMAGAVFLTSFIALMVGLAILVPYLR